MLLNYVEQFKQLQCDDDARGTAREEVDVRRRLAEPWPVLFDGLPSPLRPP